MNKKFGSWTSSQNPEELANRVKGMIIASSGVIVFVFAKVFGIELTADDVISGASQVSIVAGAIWAIYGAILALVTKFKKQ